MAIKIDIPASRRQAMKALGGLAAGAAIIAIPAPSQAQAKKLAQKTVQYIAVSKRPQNCASCTHFVEPNACKIVEGEIAAEGWCVSYAPKPKTAG